MYHKKNFLGNYTIPIDKESMMLARKLTKTYSIKEYLKLEERSNLKHEFHYGELYAMAGGTVDRSTLEGNMLTELKIALPNKKNLCSFGSV